MNRKFIAAVVLHSAFTICTCAHAGLDPERSVLLPAPGAAKDCTIDPYARHQAGAATDPTAPAGKGVNQPAPAVQPKVVFQINQVDDASAVLRFVTNYLIAEPAAEVTVVGYGGGIDFMLKGAVDAAGRPYADQLKLLANRGIVFKVCNNTLKARGLGADAVAPSVSVVPGAVNEIIRLQTREGYAYFRH
jgi:intracellular sulfur oxidation DsrE/DsrF family protein